MFVDYLPWSCSTPTYNEEDEILVISMMDEVEENPLLASSCLVEELAESDIIVDAELVYERDGDEIETFATPPMEFDCWIPEGLKPGQTFQVLGPHGLFEATVPENGKPGTRVHYSLPAPSEFVVKVPPKMSPGSVIEIQREDRMSISVTVPEGCHPGDVFEVVAPVYMVRVPQGAKGGERVVFTGEKAVLRATIPISMVPGRYFAARLPPPPL